ncbi:hypothetical protein KAFR_0A06500 [Kazachstania africana CBS 2517]|uniref:GOLD domain-containing protein n=1 Tax=Kazachstania africana (strain ATCC 22294 / BCRC 22015 / CBS 2517 / CECT 1963 / NBRC 1671 / NRRL Y-8276) TaxID=1071382 RepID=H2ANY5_KAZAF|nr:hypothetical protein KAFR_0A06500 [Kazachstania africana CBS 2517]CCF56085.1 hypothetical protein KAFR_0A06500 [Kazachstania africana CBS 2517]
MIKLVNLVALLVTLIVQVQGFYFYTSSNERKCFHKELTKGNLLQGQYKLSAQQNDVSITIDIEEVFDNNHRVMHQKMGSLNGEFAYNALDSGEHKICFQTSSSSWINKEKNIKFEIDMEIGDDLDLDSKKTATIKSLQNKVFLLTAKTLQIKNEQRLMRDREAMFRDLSESCNSRAMWWTVLQIVVLGATCFWQIKHLSTFFVKQKVL